MRFPKCHTCPVRSECVTLCSAVMSISPLRCIVEKHDIIELIVKLARETKEEPDAVLAFADIESSFNPDAIRDEPKIKDASYGLFQILFRTAQDRGFAQNPVMLFDPETNTRLAIETIQWIRNYLLTHLGHTPVWEEIAAAYNAGVGNVCHGFIPATYVARWKLARRKWQSYMMQSQPSASPEQSPS